MARYFKAFTIPVKPLIQWDCFANDDDEYRDLGLNRDHTVVAEENIPANQYGVCPWKIDDKGSLIGRSPGEMETYRLEYENQTLTNNFKGRAAEINRSTFLFQGQNCLMDESSRVLYDLLEKGKITTVTEIKTVEGYLSLKTTDVPAFLNEYYAKLVSILNTR